MDQLKPPQGDNKRKIAAINYIIPQRPGVNWNVDGMLGLVTESLRCGGLKSDVNQKLLTS